MFDRLFRATCGFLLSLVLGGLSPQALAAINGTSDRLDVAGNGATTLFGWACDTNVDSSIDVRIYVRNSDGSLTYLTSTTANQSSESAVATACGRPGSTVPHRWGVSLQSYQAAHAGKVLVSFGYSSASGVEGQLQSHSTFVLPAMTQQPPGPVVGNIDNFYNEGGVYVLSGWSCDKNVDQSNDVELYVFPNGTGSSGVPLTRVTTNRSNEAGVATACGTPGSAVPHRFAIPLTDAQTRYPGHLVYVYGYSKSGGAIVMLPNSGTLVPPALQNAAQYVEQVVPAKMTAGATYSVRVRMKNTGSTSWTTTSGHLLGTQNPQDNTTWQIKRVAPAATVAPQAFHDFVFSVKAPSTPGYHNFQWRMVKELVEWFGDTTPNVSVEVVPPPVNGSAFVSQVIPTKVVAGQKFPVEIVMKNTGTTVWTAADRYSLLANSYNWGLTNIVPATPVSNGQQYAFKADVTAPATPGNYTMLWSMFQENVGGFGLSPAVTIEVSAAPIVSATFVGQTVASPMMRGEWYNVTVSMKNTGDVTWPAGGIYRLASENPTDNTVWGMNRVQLANATAPGETATFGFRIKAPTTAGTYNFQWRMIGTNDVRFGASSTNAIIEVKQPTSLAGAVDYLFGTSTTTMMAGWACAVGNSTPVKLHIYVGGDLLTGTKLPIEPIANLAGDSTVANLCGTTNTSLRFKVDLQAYRSAHAGKPVWVYAVASDGFSVSNLGNSPLTMPAVSAVHNAVAGNLERLQVTDSQAELSGWTCSQGSETPIKVELYMGGDRATGTRLPIEVFANQSGESQIATACGTTNSNFRWRVNLQNYRAQHAGKTIYAYGVSNDGTATKLIGNPAAFIMPAPVNGALSGAVTGVRAETTGSPQLVGWACRDSVAQPLTYQVSVNAPLTQGGILLGSGTANVATEAGFATVAAQCRTPGAAHHFVFDLTTYVTQYPDARLYVHASGADGVTQVLPCEALACNIPGTMRIGFTTLKDNDQFLAPATIFLRAKVTGVTSYDGVQVAFLLNGKWTVAAPDSEAGAYFVQTPALPASSDPYVVTARVSKGSAALYTKEIRLYVRSATAIAVSLTTPTNGATVSVNSPLSLRASVGATVTAVKFYAGGALIANGSNSGGNDWIATWTTSATGAYAITASAYDGSGTLLGTSPSSTVTITDSASSSAPLAVSITPPHLSNADAGTLPGELMVGKDGAATYSVALVVPPGTAGLAPALSLNYASTAPNGLVGLGWSLGGLSSIHRCPKIISVDGIAGRISFDNADRLCLDGQRLVRVNGTNPGTDLTAQDNAYWAADAEYRTEIETFARVTGSGSGYKVEQKNGRIAFYGTEAASTIPAQGRSDGKVLLWPISRVQDRSSNYMFYEYTVDTATGEYVPAKIVYGGNTAANSAPDLAVMFAYEVRPDTNIQYMGGSRNDLRKRLTHVRTYTGTSATGTGGILAQDYEIHYMQSASSGRSLVDWVRACGVNPVTSATECLPETTFNWGAGGVPTLVELPVASSLPVPPTPVVRSNPNGALLGAPYQYQANLDGSGLTSFVANRRFICSGSQFCGVDADNILQIRLPGKPEFARTLNLSGTGIENSATIDIRAADLDGDGRDDLILAKPGDVNTASWAYCRTVPQANGEVDFACKNGGAGSPATVLNFKNDRKAQVVMPFDSNGNTTVCSLNNGTMSCAPLAMIQQDQLLGANGFHNKVTFNMAGIDLSKQGMSDFGIAWKNYIPAADPAHACNSTEDPATSPRCINEDVHLGVAACFNAQGGLVCKSVFQQNYAGEVDEAITTRLDVTSTRSVGDLNGDGLTDFIYTLKNVAGAQTLKSIICLSKESGVDCSSVAPLTETYSLMPWYLGGAIAGYVEVNFAGSGVVGDFVGDGVNRFLTVGSYPKLCHLIGAELACDAVPNNLPVGPVVPANLDSSGIPSFLLIGSSHPSAAITSYPSYSGVQFPYRAYTFRGPAEADKLIRVANGFGHKSEADYTRGDNAAVYKDFAMNNGAEQRPAYPQVLAPPGVLVKQVRTDNGQQGWLRKDFYYEGAMADALGRGSLGFTTMRVTELESGIATTSTMSQTWPYTGMVVKSQSVSPNGVPLIDSGATPTHKILTQANQAVTVYPFAASENVTRKDWNGAALGTTSTTNGFMLDVDPVGWNQSSQTVVVGGGGKTFTTTTLTNFKNSRANWLVGLPTVVSVTKSATGQPDIARNTTYEHDTTTGLLSKEIVEANDVTLKVVNDYLRNRNVFGLVNTKKQTWRDPDANVDKTRNVSDVDYDPKGRYVTTERNALGHTTNMSFYAGTGARRTLLDANQLTTQWHVDAFGRITLESRADGTQTRQYYKNCQGDCDNNASHVTIVDSFKGTSRISVPGLTYNDRAGRKVRQLTWGFDGRQVVVDYRYDSRGRLYETDQPRFADAGAYLAERTLYDDLNRVTDVISKDEIDTERSTRTEFNGLMVTSTNARNQNKVTTNNAVGEPEEVKDAIGGITKFEYDAFGNLTTTTDPNGNLIKVGYDTLGRRNLLQDPDLGLITYHVDPLGRTWKQINPKQRAAGTFGRMEFDVLDRMTQRYEPDLKSHWVFDIATKGVGRLAEAYTGSPTLKDYRRVHTYDAFGRPDETTQTLTDGTYLAKAIYDSWGRTIEQHYRRGAGSLKQFSLRYNNMGYLERIERGSLVLWKATVQDAAHRVREALLGNGLTDVRGYSPYSARLQRSTLKGDNQSLRIDESYLYDALGNVKTRSQYWNGTGFSETFDYDALNRVEYSYLGAVTQKYVYDLAGNLRSKSDVGAYVYPTQGPTAVRPHAATSIAGQAFTYDANGNMESGAGRTIIWTSFDMPDRISAAGVSSTFRYGPEYRRTLQTKADGSTVIYAGAQEVETSSSGAVKIKTYWPNGIGLEIDQPGSTATEFVYVHKDRIGSPVVITSQAGVSIEELAYDTWGKRRTTDGSATPNSLDGRVDNRGFTGHEMLDQLDLVHMNGRVYDPRTARFISADPLIQDPINGQSYNRYTYVLNNPTNLTDPTGFASKDERIRDEFRENTTLSDEIVKEGGEEQQRKLFAAANRSHTKAANSGTFSSFVGELKPGEFFKQAGRKLLDDFVNNNQESSSGSNAYLRWLAGMVEGTYEKPDTTSANGTAATVGVAAATLLTPGGARGAIAKEIQLSRKLHGEAAVHAADAIAAGKPSILTIDRLAAPANRNASIGALDKVPAKHLDEYPPAMFKEGGSGASVRAINPRDNMSAGACIGNACRGLPNGAKVRITVGD